MAVSSSLNSGASRKRPWVCPLMTTPQSPSSVIARLASMIAAPGSWVGRVANALNRSGWARDCFGALVVERSAEVGGGFDGDLLGSRRRDREDLHVDTRVVHDPQSLLVDVRQFRGEAFRCHRGRPHLVDEIGGKHMFFESDECHGGPSRESVLGGAFGPYHRASALPCRQR